MLDWIRENLLFGGMIATGMFGLLCVVVVNHFYNRTLRDLRQMKEAKGAWTLEFLREYRERLNNQQKINNPEVFVRAQLLKGKVAGIALQKWKQGISWGAMLCFFLIMAAVYGNYRHQTIMFVPQQYILFGTCVFLFLLLMRQFMSFFNKEDMISDGLLDYMENMNRASDVALNIDATKEQVREELINRVVEGISQTAASQNRFSHMLTSEEEKIVREVILEYLT